VVASAVCSSPSSTFPFSNANIKDCSMLSNKNHLHKHTTVTKIAKNRSLRQKPKRTRKSGFLWGHAEDTFEREFWSCVVPRKEKVEKRENSFCFLFVFFNFTWQCEKFFFCFLLFFSLFHFLTPTSLWEKKKNMDGHGHVFFRCYCVLENEWRSSCSEFCGLPQSVFCDCLFSFLGKRCIWETSQLQQGIAPSSVDF
jgi:hypothetical protein